MRKKWTDILVYYIAKRDTSIFVACPTNCTVMSIDIRYFCGHTKDASKGTRKMLDQNMKSFFWLLRAAMLGRGLLKRRKKLGFCRVCAVSLVYTTTAVAHDTFLERKQKTLD